jgi:hypothetical protein
VSGRGRLDVMAATLVAAALSSCGTPADAPTGSVGAVATVTQSVTVPGVKAVWVRLYGPTAKGGHLDLWAELSRISGGYQVSLTKVPPGTYQLHGKAFSSSPYDPVTSVPDYETASDPMVKVTAKSTESVAIVLQQNPARWPPGTFTDHAPVVESLVASAFDVDSSGPPAPISLAAIVSDLDGAADIASVAWTARYAPALPAGSTAGVFDSPSAATTSWVPPQDYEGQVTFTFSATDRKAATASLAVTLAVSPKNGHGAVIVSAQLDNFPDVTRFTATPSQPAPGALVALSVTAADADGDPLSYTWSDGGCGGTFGAPSGGDVTYRAPPSPTTCTLTVVVRDLDASDAPKGGQSTGALTIAVRTVTREFAPDFVLAYQAPAGPVAPGVQVIFGVDVVEPTSGGATRPVASVAWSDGRGGAFTPRVTGLPLEVEWAAPACAALSPPYRVDVTATATAAAPVGGGSPAATSFTFPVTVACP